MKECFCSALVSNLGSFLPPPGLLVEAILQSTILCGEQRRELMLPQLADYWVPQLSKLGRGVLVATLVSGCDINVAAGINVP